MQRPDVGTVGRALTRLAPSGEIEVAGLRYSARSERGEIGVGSEVVVTGFGFGTTGLLVREHSRIDGPARAESDSSSAHRAEDGPTPAAEERAGIRAERSAAPDRRPRNRVWRLLGAVVAVLVLIGAGGYGLVAILQMPDVWIFVNDVNTRELTVLVDGSPTPLQSKSGTHFRCRSGTRNITIQRGGTTVFNETKTLRPPANGKVSKYLLSLGDLGFYYTFEREYGSFEASLNKLRNDIHNSLRPSHAVFPQTEEEKIDTLYRQQLDALRKFRFQAVEGKWLEVNAYHYILQYPSSLARVNPSKMKSTLRAIVPALSREHYERMKRLNDTHRPSQEDVKFLDDFLYMIQNSGGSTEPFEDTE
jgi:hypothetical protein